MMRNVKKINMRSASLFLTNKEMRKITGGYDGGSGNCSAKCKDGTAIAVDKCPTSLEEGESLCKENEGYNSCSGTSNCH